MKKYLNFLLLFALLLLAFSGVVTHAFIASGYVNSLIANRLNTTETVVMPTMLPQLSTQLSGTLTFLHIEDNSGAYNTGLMVDENGQGNYSLGTTLHEAVYIATASDERVWGGLAIPLPFVIPLVVHLLLVAVARAGLIAWIQRYYRCQAAYRGYLLHAFYAGVFGYLIVSVFQVARTVWASQAWGSGAYLNDSATGNIGVLGLLVVAAGMYIYCIVGTMGIRLQQQASKKCLRCGYAMGDAESCPECNLRAGTQLRSKLRVQVLPLLAAVLLLCFLPVVIASVQSIF